MRFTRSRNEDGVALITVLMMLGLISAMLVATTALVVKDQRARFQDHNRTDTFYVAHAGLEKITNDLGRVFSVNYAPSATDLANVMSTPPAIGGMQFKIPGGAAGSGYRITKLADLPPQTIQTGAFAGLQGIVTPYVIDVTAQSPARSEVSLRREMNTIAIPVFQFGIFSETDLSFFPGPRFNFGGRVHTNGNLYLAKGNNDDLILADRVTAYKDVIRHQLANGEPTATNYNGEVRILTTDNGCDTDTTAATCRPIALTEGSLTSSNTPNTNWSTVSLGGTYYAGFIKNGANGDVRGTGAQRLVLPITSGGAPAVELIRRAAVNEDTANNNLYIQRFYSMASLRILLSDAPANLDNLPGKASGTNAKDVTTIPRAAQTGSGYPYTTGNGQAIVGGWIKIEMQNQAGTSWTDVTDEIVNLGISGPSIGNPGDCVPATGSIIRLQRVKDAPNTADCAARTNYWSNTLYDEREGAIRDNNATAGTGIYLGGIMHYVEIDILELRKWMRDKRATNSIMETTGYVVYFSDRRGNRNAAGNETGEYGFEDIVYNNNGLDTGEDFNGNGTLETYGGQTSAAIVGAGAVDPFDADATPFGVANTVTLPGPPIVTHEAHSIARASKPIFFRRALKLVNGNRANMLTDVPVTATTPRLGLTVVSENPLYIQGDYNATTSEGAATYTNEHVACAVIADAVTLLSRNWNDRTSFQQPHRTDGRPADTTYYRTAVVSGKGINFPMPSGTEQDFGTDGGTHNFLRYLEDWSGDTLNYRGSIVSLFYSYQGTGTFKCCDNVYEPPNRAYVFDDEFLTPSLLPPRTPMFRTIDVTNFTRLSEPPTP